MRQREIELAHELRDQDRDLEQADVLPDAGAGAGAELYMCFTLR